jgi:hypothetical protein
MLTTHYTYREDQQMEEVNTGENKQELLAGMWASDGGSMFQGESSVVDFHEPSNDSVKTLPKAGTKIIAIATGTLSESLQKMNDSATKKPDKVGLSNAKKHQINTMEVEKPTHTIKTIASTALKLTKDGSTMPMV